MEEQACLVSTRSDSETSAKISFGTMAYTEDRLTGTEAAGEPGTAVSMTCPPEIPQDNDSGELLDPGDSSVLDQFHDDALRQAGCGLSQARVVLASSLAVGGASLELSGVPFILPSAEIELCILPHEKNWLVLISLVGAALGALFWGALGSRLGCRRVLLSALAVNAVFAPVAAFMPTYGTFMMARFCSAIGSGGVVPACYTYTGSVCRGAARRHARAVLVLGAGGGALAAAALAGAVLPPDGERALVENDEHFSAWHRYLLICILPILASLVCLIWTQESPRYLLEVGREVDAMTVYQSMHSSNQVVSCGWCRQDAPRPPPPYPLCELALPHKLTRHTAQPFWLCIAQLFSITYRRTTLCLGGVLLFTMAMPYYLSSYVPSTVLSASSELFQSSVRVVQNASIADQHYNTTLQNVQFYNASFHNCTFSDMLLSHAAFKNCSFYDVAFLNIKTSYTFFTGCLFVNSSIIDTDMELGRELDQWCVLNGSVMRGMETGCSRHADLTSRLQPYTDEQSYVSHAMLIASVLALLPQNLRPLVAICIACVLVSPSLYMCRSETAMYVVEAVYRGLVTLACFTVAEACGDKYPTHLRCTALGLMLSVSYGGGAIVWGVGSGGALTSALICALFSGVATLLAVKGR